MRLILGDRHKAYTRARWRAFRALADQGYNYSGIARAAGVDHTSVRYGVLRIDAIDAYGSDPYRIKTIPHFADFRRARDREEIQ